MVRMIKMGPENRKFKRWMLRKMKPSERAAFIGKEQFYKELEGVHKELKEFYKDVVQKNAPEWQRDIALSIPAKWYEKVVERIALVFCVLGMKPIGFIVNKLLLSPVEWLSRYIYNFGTKAVQAINGNKLSVFVYRHGKIVFLKTWEFKTVADLKAAMKRAEELKNGK